MPGSREITRTELRIAEVDALQQTIDQLRQDLQAYGEALRQKLAMLRQGPAAAPSAPPVEGAPSEFADLDEAFFRDLDEAIHPTPGSSSSPFEFEEMEEVLTGKVGGKPVSVRISDSGINDEELSGWVLDRPEGGLKILVDDEIKIETVIRVRPTRDHPDAQWISVSVKEILPERQSFVISCQFAEQPPRNVLALFNG